MSRYGNRNRSVEGTFQPEINPRLSHRISIYCSATDQNRTKFVEQCMEEALDRLEPATYETMDNAALAKLVLRAKNLIDGQEADGYDQRQLCIL